MRKFVIKNRQKRKYIKKSEQQSSLSFIKTLYGMLPLLIMMVALMTTMIITSPLRDPQASIRFTFDLPTISFQNPFIFFQTLADFLGEGFLAFVSGFATLIDSFIHILQSGVNSALYTVMLLDPRPLFLVIGSGFMTIVVAISFMCTQIIHVLLTLFLIISYFFQLFVTSIAITSTAVLHFIGTTIIAAGRSAVTVVVTLTQVMSVIGLTIFHFFVMVGQTVIAWIWSVLVAFAVFINHLIDAIVQGIEWPFKIIGAFLYKFKPVGDMLGKHIALAASDLGGCFSNFGKTINYLSSTK
jgi:hypothetical protein